jgi:hypothetical protein
MSALRRSSPVLSRAVLCCPVPCRAVLCCVAAFKHHLSHCLVRAEHSLEGVDPDPCSLPPSPLSYHFHHGIPKLDSPCPSSAFLSPPPEKRDPLQAAKGAKTYEKAEDPIYALKNNLPIDCQHYLDHHLAQPLMRLFEPILKNPKELLTGAWGVCFQ